MEFKLSDIIKSQAILNVGCIGSVSHGKSTMVEKLTGIKTQKHSKELERNITINLGYANIKIYYNKDTGVFQNEPGEGFELYRHISFVDCPGHKALAATMISGSQVMNAAILVIAMNETIPQPQTLAHTEVLKHTDIQSVLVVPNKIDLLKNEKEVTSSCMELEKYIKTVDILHQQSTSIIPISGFKNINTEYITRYLSTISRESIQEKVNKEFSMYVLRSFDVNYVNTEINSLKGGVIGGSIQSGFIEIGDTIVLSPGIVKNNVCIPIIANVVSIFSEKTPLTIAFPGGLVALGLDCDPSLCKQNLLLGNSIQKLGRKIPELGNVFQFEIEYLKDPMPFQKLTSIIVLVNSRSIKSKIIKKEEIINKKQIVTVQLDIPIILTNDYNYPIMTLIGDTIELFALGKIVSVVERMEIKLPSNFEKLVPKENKIISIIDDLPEVEFNEKEFTIANVSNNILPHIKTKKLKLYNLPDILVNKDPTRLIWKNYLDFAHLLDQLYANQTFDLNLRIFLLKNVIGFYIRYFYNIDESGVSVTNESISVHIKTRGLKIKLENVIDSFLTKYYNCDKCKDFTARLGKIGSKINKVCFECSSKNIINDAWITKLK